MEKKFTMPFLLLAVFFCVFLILANLMEVKVVQIGFLTATAGLAVFPVSYIINDCIVEVYGFKKARFVIWLGFLMNFVVVLFLQLAIILPSDSQWGGQVAIEAIYGNTSRILLGSFTAFICGSMVNAYIMSKMKLMSGGKNFSARAILSTLFGESVDSMVFFPIAFGGILSWETILILIWTQALLKTIYEIIILPVTIRVVKYLKAKEGIDTFDDGISYKWWRIDQL
ncbi:MAG: queuosine precursor transporter [Muribaculaceae bacterium]